MSDTVDSTISVKTAVMNQLPLNNMNTKASSPLMHVNLLDSAKNLDNKKISLIEEKFLGYLVLRGNAGDKNFKQAIENTLACELPTVLQCIYNDDLSIRWISPDEWLIVCAGDTAFKLETSLRKVLGGHYSICNISGGQTLLVLSGAHARDVLMKSTSYDVSGCQFPVGKVVTTTVSKSQAIICRKDENVWELIIRRSFADYIWLWLQDAGAEFNR
jgi:sarcosine oxidase subunit gamma